MFLMIATFSSRCSTPVNVFITLAICLSEIPIREDEVAAPSIFDKLCLPGNVISPTLRRGFPVKVLIFFESIEYVSPVRIILNGTNFASCPSTAMMSCGSSALKTMYPSSPMFFTISNFIFTYSSMVP